ncbi:hypothetical protein ARMA_2681 [Ardenticatena maritima]|uniref:Uncharacterized protein n=1 Tax=Ardenticatena maritima TaxID=872965 RepID=A0A0N0RFU0_9CHLR|nr:hypothetical protein ARMA_2681 [Ardenticatena maritima]
MSWFFYGGLAYKQSDFSTTCRLHVGKNRRTFAPKTTHCSSTVVLSN